MFRTPGKEVENVSYPGQMRQKCFVPRSNPFLPGMQNGQPFITQVFKKFGLIEIKFESLMQIRSEHNWCKFKLKWTVFPDFMQISRWLLFLYHPVIRAPDAISFILKRPDAWGNLKRQGNFGFAGIHRGDSSFSLYLPGKYESEDSPQLLMFSTLTTLVFP